MRLEDAFRVLGGGGDRSVLLAAAPLIEVAEGVRHRVYDCGSGQPIVTGSIVRGHPTVGVGRNLAGKGVNEFEISLMFARDLVDAERDAAAWFGSGWSGLDVARRAALVEMSFQLGPATLDRFRQTLGALRRGAWREAAAGMRASRWAVQTPRRVERLARVIETGVL